GQQSRALAIARQHRELVRCVVAEVRVVAETVRVDPVTQQQPDPCRHVVACGPAQLLLHHLGGRTGTRYRDVPATDWAGPCPVRTRTDRLSGAPPRTPRTGCHRTAW